MFAQQQVAFEIETTAGGPNAAASQFTMNTGEADANFFVGSFAPIRARLDYSYHCMYSTERQLLQDEIILAFLSKGKYSVQGLQAIYTAGAMGVGKTFVMDQLQRKGLFCLDDFVYVDPDAMRECIPEYRTYLERDAETAGNLTQKESGLMAEILTYAALECGMSVIVDGSLRDSSWYEMHFSELRQQFPEICLSIFFITAPLEDVYQRVVHRSEETGRCIPKSVLEDSISRVPAAVAKLREHVDALIEIRNGSKTGVEIVPMET